ncbi:MAG: DUF192 domain-containing protein [Chloroherpetonaceae bacterium]|nr:DUF192 domain-containing protein [Chloroherpetonaceae bacterium]
MIDTAMIWVEIADEELEREKGLMFRESMPEDEGMLFVFESPRLLSFWMKNTFIPLDIAYIDQNGFIVDILHMKAEGASTKPDEDFATYPGSKPAVYALELNEGWFKKRGIGVGTKVRFN